MKELDTTEPKAKRMRINPVKKWTKEEERALITFLLENRDFEKPTAQVYYKRFAKVSNIAVDWKLTRSKVRNMRTSYNKAKEWEGSTDTANMEGEALKTNLIRMCHFFYAFDEIFGDRLDKKPVFVESWLSPSSNYVFSSTELNSEEATCSETGSLPSNCDNKIYSTAAVSDIMQFQGEILSLKRHKIERELVLKEREVEIKERELGLKEKEMEFKEKEMKSQEKLKILELEMKERLAMEELKLKYK